MSVRLIRRVLFDRSACAGFALSFLALLAAPAWAQRGRPAPARRPASPPTRTPAPRSQAPRMSQPVRQVPMRQIPMRQPILRMRGPESRPRIGPYARPPRPISHARPPELIIRGKVRRTLSRSGKPYPGTPSGKFGILRDSPGPAASYVPTTRTMMRRPLYALVPSTPLRKPISLLQSMQNNEYQRQTSYAQPPYSLAAFFFPQPALNPGCFGLSPSSSFMFNPDAAVFSGSPLTNPFCGAAFSPSVFSAEYFGLLGTLFASNPLCPICNFQEFNPYAMGFDSGLLNPYSVSEGTSPSLRDPTLTSWLTWIATAPLKFSAFSPGEGLVNTSSSASSSAPAISDAPFTTNATALDHPLTLVFANGSKVKAIRYWVASDWKLHYVTPSGSQMAIPLGQFNMSATMRANRKDGINFLPVSAAQPQSGSAER